MAIARRSCRATHAHFKPWRGNHSGCSTEFCADMDRMCHDWMWAKADTEAEATANRANIALNSAIPAAALLGVDDPFRPQHS